MKIVDNFVRFGMPYSSAPEREIELVHAERAWYLFSRENPQGGRETLIERGLKNAQNVAFLF